MRTTFLCVTWRASSSSRLNRRSISAPRRVGHDLRADDLDRDGHAELGVPRLVDRAHAADAEHADDVIAGAELPDRPSAVRCSPPAIPSGSRRPEHSPDRHAACLGRRSFLRMSAWMASSGRHRADPQASTQMLASSVRRRRSPEPRLAGGWSAASGRPRRRRGLPDEQRGQRPAETGTSAPQAEQVMTGARYRNTSQSTYAPPVLRETSRPRAVLRRYS